MFMVRYRTESVATTALARDVLQVLLVLRGSSDGVVRQIDFALHPQVEHVGRAGELAPVNHRIGRTSPQTLRDQMLN